MPNQPPLNPCDKSHDPEPYVTSGIAMAQSMFGGRTRFDPRKKYCQDKECYDAGRHEEEITERAQEAEKTND